MKDMIEQFAEQQKQAQERFPAAIQTMKERALKQFIRQGVPNTRQEAWRFTDVSELAEIRWTLPSSAVDGAWHSLIKHLKYWQDGPLAFIFVNGRLIDAGTTTATSHPYPGLEVSPLSRKLSGQDEKYWLSLGRHADGEDHPFTALNTALFQEGALVHVSANQVIEQPIQIYHITIGQEHMAVHPRNLILLDRGSQAKVVETFIGLGDQPCLVNHVTEIVLAENAGLDHYKIQREAGTTFHIHRTAIDQKSDSRYHSLVLSFGGRMERNDLTAMIDGHNVQVELDGLYMLQGQQQVDHHTTLRHRQPRSYSRQLYKGILAGEAKAVFNGRIHVEREAQGTDAIQSNKNLLLSDSAVINTQPQLEIYADDVRCTHGGTIGQLDDEGLFYLQTRGIDRKKASAIMVRAFAGEVVDRIRLPLLREQVEAWVLEHLRWDDQ